MEKMINCFNEEVEFDGCPGCAFANHHFELPCGMAYENENFTLAQDWELPIQGFMVLAPKKHIEKLNEFTDSERNEMFEMVNKIIIILREVKICDKFNIIFEEKENRHFHVWIMPRHDWMKKLTDDIIGNIDVIFEYAKSNFRNEENYKKINEITSIIKKDMKKITINGRDING